MTWKGPGFLGLLYGVLCGKRVPYVLVGEDTRSKLIPHLNKVQVQSYSEAAQTYAWVLLDLVSTRMNM